LKFRDEISDWKHHLSRKGAKRAKFGNRITESLYVLSFGAINFFEVMLSNIQK